MCAEHETNSTDEIEVTPAMIKAGADVVLYELGGRDCLSGSFSAAALAEEVYRAMDMMRG
jgi:hypothetical protein